MYPSSTPMELLNFLLCFWNFKTPNRYSKINWTLGKQLLLLDLIFIIFLCVSFQDCLAALVRLCAVMSSSNLSQPNIVRSHGLRLLSLLTEIDGMDNPSILEIDAFGLLVALTFCAPSLFNGDQAAQLPLGTVQDQHLLRLLEIKKVES